jgi:hypothetical protein
MSFLRKHWRKIAIVFVVLVVIAATPFLIIIGLELNAERQWNKSKRLPFEQSAWKANPDSNETDPIRLRMVDDLLAHHNFMGMSRAEIDDLLGVPAPTDKFRDWDLVYWLGPERGSGRIDSEWLVFKFNNEKKVSAYRLTRD